MSGAKIQWALEKVIHHKWYFHNNLCRVTVQDITYSQGCERITHHLAQLSLGWTGHSTTSGKIHRALRCIEILPSPPFSWQAEPAGLKALEKRPQKTCPSSQNPLAVLYLCCLLSLFSGLQLPSVAF